MKVSYFPGCTLKTHAKQLDKYSYACADALGVELSEIESWQCCGGVFSPSMKEIAPKLSSVRALMEARDKGRPLVTVCSACHNVIKQTNAAMAAGGEFAERVNNYISPKEYNGEAKVLHYLELLRDEIGFGKIKEKTVNPLKGKKIAPYYGCLLLRPSKTMQMDDPENPSIMEDFIRATGAEPAVYAARNECCGGYVAVEDKTLAAKRSREVIRGAKNAGADMIVTACPLCRYNLIKNGESELPVIYFTELLAEALGVKEDGNE